MNIFKKSLHYFYITSLSSSSASIRHICGISVIICSVLKRISTEIKKINERYPRFDVVITGDYI